MSTVGNQPLAQQCLQFGETAARQQPHIVAHPRQQTLAGRQGQHLLDIQPQLPGAVAPHALLIRLDFLGFEQLVLQHIDLVEQCIQALRPLALQAAHVAFPDGQVTGGHAAVRRQQEEDDLRLGQHRQGQLGLAAQRIQPGGIEDAQPLAQQRVIDAGQRVSPDRHAHAIRLARRLQGGGVEPQTQRLLAGHRLDPRHLGEGIGHGGGILRVEIEGHPGRRPLAQLGQRDLFQAGLDRQQAQVRTSRPGIEEQLGGTHGGAPRLGRQDAPATAGEEQRVDQLGLAPRELADEGQRQLLAAQLTQGAIQACFQRRGDQPVGRQPAAVAHQHGGQRAFPLHGGINLLAEAVQAHGGMSLCEEACRALLVSVAGRPATGAHARRARLRRWRCPALPALSAAG